jgi:hypothetical protein
MNKLTDDLIENKNVKWEVWAKCLKLLKKKHRKI